MKNRRYTQRRAVQYFLLPLMTSLALGLNANVRASGPPAGANGDPEDAQRALSAVDRHFFIENKGQWPQEVLYLARLGGLNAWITRTGAVYDFYQLKEKEGAKALAERPGPDKFETKEYARYGHVVRVGHSGAGAAASGQGRLKLQGYYNYFLGNDPSRWASEVGLYKEAVVKELYPGIDVRWYFEKGGLRYDYVVAPGADPGQIRLMLEGQKSQAFRDNNLVFTTRFGEVQLMELYAYQETESGRVPVASRWKQEGRQIGIEVERYDRSRPLTIDPLVYSTLIGGDDKDRGCSIAVDGSGAAYVTGYTQSTDYPTTSGAYDETYYGGNDDVFVTKLNAAGSALVYSTFIGGYDWDKAYSIAVDGSGAAYVTGGTKSNNYPTTSGAYDGSYNDNDDAFVTKLNAAGSALVYSTFIGGSSGEYAYSIAVDGSEAAYVTGRTNSNNYPTTPGAYDGSLHVNGGYDGFVTKLNAAGSALVYSTFIGGNNSFDYGYSIAVDGSGAAYVTGYTYSPDYPTTSGAYDETYNGNQDVFVTKLNAAGSALVYSTFIGGNDEDRAFSIAVDGSGAAYVTGYTYSTDYPTTSGAYDETYNGNQDVFVTKLNAAGSALVYSTFIGGSKKDWGNSIAVDGSGAAYVTGATESSDYPTTPGVYDGSFNGGYGEYEDVFLTKLNAAGSALVYSTFIGGNDRDEAFSIALDGSGAAYMTGATETNYYYPTTSGAYDISHNGGYEDVFVTKLNPTPLSHEAEIVAENTFDVQAFPVPFHDVVQLLVETFLSEEPVHITVMDLHGRIIENRQEQMLHNGLLSLGEDWASGVYMIRVQQGSELRTLRVVKTTN
ncbi:MAG: SBBP repeat-containing protein [Flavobacteriales bacterium]|nr:SBBP repeat-containing protein [Flavobacteriales bacterium]